MQTLLTRKRLPLMAWLGVTILALLLAGCGGGGGGKSSSSSSSTSNSGTVSATLSGVAANGAPLIGARVSAIDATGTSMGSTLASVVNGEYQLSVTSAKFPLLVQASGVDMYGNPVVLHTVVLSAATGTNARTVAHVSPLTNAVVAMLMGGDPRTRFQTPSSITSAMWTTLGNSTAVTSAAAYLLTVITPNLTAAKPTALNKATLNIFSDANFQADKTALDAVLEALRLQFGKDVNGNELLKLSNSLILAGSSEVTINLTTTKAGLSATIPAIASGAITSTRTTTTTASAITHVADLATLQSTINNALAAGTLASTGGSLPSFISSTYNYFSGLDAAGLLLQFVGYGTAGYQLSPFQVVGCLDDPVPSSGCAKVRVASLVRSLSTGQVVQTFENIVSWTSGSGWTFVGNNAANMLRLYPVAWKTWTASGVANGNAGRGLQVNFSANPQFPILTQAPTPAPRLTSPNGSVSTFYAASVDPTKMLVSSTETGDLLSDEVLAVTQSGPLSEADVAPGAQYKLNSTTFAFTGGVSPTVDKEDTTRLTADLPSNVADSAYPLPDGLSTLALSITDFTSGLSINWSTWAAANPQMRMVEIRAVITSTTSAPVYQVVQIPPMAATNTTLSSMTAPGDAIQYTLWMIARDDKGRRYISKIIAQ